MKRIYALFVAPVVLLSIIAGCGTSSTLSQTHVSYASSTNAPSVSGTSPNTSSTSWIHFDKGTKTVTLGITAAKTTDNNGFNFNGFSQGEMTVIIPVNWHVDITFTNRSKTAPHSLEIVPYAERLSTTGFSPAFTNSTVQKPQTGITFGQTKRLTFVVDKAGNYAFVCGVPDHSSEGMWDGFVVSSKARIPIITTTTVHTNNSTSGW